MSDSPEQPARDQSKLRVLLVEDEVLISIFVEQLLADLGCEVVGPVTDIHTGVELAETAAIDAAILNIVIDNVPAYAIADVLAARSIPFAFSSGIPRDSVSDRWRDRPFLTKPYLLDDILRLLRQLVPQWRGPVEGSGDTEKSGEAVASAVQAEPLPVRTPNALS